MEGGVSGSSRQSPGVGARPWGRPRASVRLWGGQESTEDVGVIFWFDKDGVRY